MLVTDAKNLKIAQHDTSVINHDDEVEINFFSDREAAVKWLRKYETED